MIAIYEIETDSARDSDAYRQEVADWLKANDVDPNDIPINAVIRVNDLTKTIRLERYRRGEDGKLVINAAHDDAVREKFSVPLKVNWPLPESPAARTMGDLDGEEGQADVRLIPDDAPSPLRLFSKIWRKNA